MKFRFCFERERILKNIRAWYVDTRRLFCHRLRRASKPILGRRQSLKTSFEVIVSDVAASHGFLHILLEDPSIALQNLCRLFVQRVFRVGFEEQILESVYDGIYGEDGLPVLAQYVEAYIALEINVRMVNLRFAFYFRRLMRISLSHFEAEHEFSSAIEPLVGADGQLEGQEVVRIREIDIACFRETQFVDILGYA